jgi:transportin-3
MPEWQEVVTGMIEQFGKEPSTVAILLGFLKALVEESGNPKIPLSVCHAAKHVGHLLTSIGRRGKSCTR